MDKIDYAILGWMADRGPSSPKMLASLLETTPEDVISRIATLRVQGKITYTHETVFRDRHIIETRRSQRQTRRP